METVDPIGLLVPATYLVMLAIEAIRPARAFPPRRGWRWIGIAFLLLVGTLSTLVPLALPLPWIEAHRWMDGSGLGIVGGTVVGYGVLSGIAYAYHRLCHHWTPLWRASHQIHHSPQRVDMSGAALFHPVEVVVHALLQLFVTVVVLGLHPIAAALVGFVAAFYGFFQHWNVHTPRWLGYVIQRPEAHCEHHRLGVHAWNYGDLPIWDLLFGTFRNPAHFDGRCGFEAPADRRVWAMLGFADVNATAYGDDSRGVAHPAARPGGRPATMGG